MKRRNFNRLTIISCALFLLTFSPFSFFLASYASSSMSGSQVLALSTPHTFSLPATLVSTLRSSSTQPTQNQLSELAKSLNSRYNSTVGLVFESTTAGTHSFSPDYHLNQTFWIWNDNAQAVWALQGYYPAISTAINATIQHYVSEYNLPSPNYDEVFWGSGATTQIHTADNAVVTDGTKFVILAEIHNEAGIFGNWQQYENLVIVHSLNNYINNNYTGAIADFRLAEKMWNGQGMVDTTVNIANPVYSSYKLAAIIFDAKVLNIWNTNMTAIQNELWSHQTSTGGIRTGYGSGEIASQVNSTNSETDSLTLMAYNANLISRIQYPVQLTSTVQSLAIKRGSSTTFNVIGMGDDQNLTLSSGKLPTGIQLSFSKNTAVGISNIVTVKVTSSATRGTHPITITATGQDTKKGSVSVSLTVS